MIQAEYLRGLRGYLEDFTQMIEAAAAQVGENLDPGQARSRAIATYAEMVGTLIVSRAIAKVDPELANEVLDSNRRHLTP